MGEGKREGNKGLEVGFALTGWQQQAWCGAWTQEPWDHDLSWSWMLNWLSHPWAPFLVFNYSMPTRVLISVFPTALTAFNIQNLLIFSTVYFLLFLLEYKFCSRVLGWLSWLSIWLRLSSWSRGWWIQAPYQASCSQVRAWSLLWILHLPLSLPLLCSHSACQKKFCKAEFRGYFLYLFILSTL